MSSRPKALAAIAAAAIALLSLAALADAELTQKGNLLVRFNGGVTPRVLPRHSLAPVSVRVDATIRVPAGHSPPPLRHIEIALNKGGRLTTTGLPVCRRGEIDSATTAGALQACQSALVGAGGIVGRTAIADQKTFVLRGDLLLFNSRDHGRQAILGHVYQSKPAPISHVIVFRIRHPRGAYGTVLSADVPYAINHNGYLKSIFLQLQRRYTFRGRRLSYLSASCPAPAGFPRATFRFARASMGFADGRTLSSTMVRTCKTKG